jgi:hypothetical protein
MSRSRRIAPHRPRHGRGHAHACRGGLDRDDDHPPRRRASARRPGCMACIAPPDVVVVPAGGDPAGEQESAMRQWIARQHDRGAHVFGVCSGSMVLAEAGVLDGRDLALGSPQRPREKPSRGGQGRRSPLRAGRRGHDHGRRHVGHSRCAQGCRGSGWLRRSGARRSRHQLPGLVAGGTDHHPGATPHARRPCS